MTAHVSILHKIYGDLVGSPWELSNTKDCPERGLYFSPTCMSDLWVEIKFGIHNREGVFISSASLKLFDPFGKGTAEKSVYIELQAFDAPRFSDSGINVFTGKGSDYSMRMWSDLVLELACVLKAQTTYSRLRELIEQRYLVLPVFEQQEFVCMANPT